MTREDRISGLRKISMQLRVNRLMQFMPSLETVI